MSDTSLPDDADRPDRERPVAHYERRRHHGSVEATLASPSDISPSFDDLHIAAKDADGVEEESITLTRQEVCRLAHEIGWTPLRPPIRNTIGDPEAHLEVADYGDHVRVDTPTAVFSVRFADRASSDPWVIREHDEGYSWIQGAHPTKEAAVTHLLARLGVTGESPFMDPVEDR